MSLATLAEANTYFASQLHTEAWNVDDVVRQKALDHSTRVINRLNFATDTDLTVQPIKDACCEVALSLLDAIDPDLEIKNLSITQEAIAGVRTSHNRDHPAEHILHGIPSFTAWRLLKPYLKDSRSVTLTRHS